MTGDDSTVEPSLSVSDTWNRSANLTATVSLPEAAAESRRLVARLEVLGGGVVANRTLSVDPGESVAVDFGACLPANSYVARLVTLDGDVLVADQVDVERATPLVALTEDPLEAYAERATRDETVRVDASLHRCVDRATLALVPASDGETSGEREAVWAVTLRDTDGDGSVSLSWDVDAPPGEAVTVGARTTLVSRQFDTESVQYGAYRLLTTTPDGDGETGRVTVSFAEPTVDVYGVNGTLTADAALSGARDAEPLVGEHAVRVVDGDWVVLRFDVDGTLSELPSNASLVAPATHGNATVRVRDAVAGPETDAAEVDLANATRWFDAETGTLWYAYRADQTNDANVFEYAALGETWNATARTTVRAVDAVTLDVEPDGRLAPETVTLDGDTALPPGTNLTVTVRTAAGVVARDGVVAGPGRFDATLDLSAVPNGTNASVVVTRDDRVVHQRAVTVVSEPVLELRGFRANDGDDQLRADERNVVRAFLWNRGNAAGNATVVVSVGNRTRTRNVTLPPSETRGVAVTFPPAAIPDRDRVDVSVAVAGETTNRSHLVVPAASTPTATPATTTASGTEPWPTLAGTNRTPGDGSTPGFGAVAAVAALGAALAVVAGRARDDD